jgi:hypothetical protein
VKLDQLIDDVCEQETALAKQLRTVAERHAAEHDIYHIGHAQARACAQRIEQLTPHAERYGLTRPTVPASESPGIIEEVRHKTANLLGRTKTSGELLLADLKKLYLAAQATELAWTILAQSAQGARDRELLTAATTGQEKSTVCAKWVRTRIKEAAPQVYAAGSG